MKLFCIAMFLIIFISISGCFSSDDALQAESPDEYLIQVNDRVVTVRDFKHNFEIVESLYPYNSLQDTDFIKNTMANFLNQLVDEMVLAERAEELNINITDDDLEKVVSDIKKDYPDNQFEKILFENAIAYKFWENSVKVRLLMEKVIEKDLGEKVAILPEDITKYYKKYFKAKNAEADLKKNELISESDDINKTIVKHLRRKKMEDEHNSWIGDLKKKYNIKVNMLKWDKIIEG
ncbi:MAG: SurA N-terminal domain-containing protein [Deltaproteobacteria bacterium]|nr:SurA N-terminal domain-containing protein [Deltaproteobacteria bacterium]